MSFIQSLFPDVKKEDSHSGETEKSGGKKKIKQEKTSWIESLYPDAPPTKAERKKPDNAAPLPVKEFVPTGEELNQGYIISTLPKKKVMIEYLRKRIEQLVSED